MAAVEDGIRAGDRSLAVRRVLAYCVAATASSYYALRGGSYDIVLRQAEAIVIWLILAVGLLFGFFPRRRLPSFARVPICAIALLTVWTALSLAWTTSDERTLAEVARLLHYCGLVLLVWCLVDRTTWESAASGLATAAFLVCVVALSSRLVPELFPASDVARVLHTRRLDYPLNYWNGVAAWAGMSITIALAYSGHARSLVVRLVCLGAVPICATTLYLTYSRSGIAGTLVGVVAVVALSRNRWVTALHAVAAGAATLLVVVVIRSAREIAEGRGGGGAGTVGLALAFAAAVCSAAAWFTWRVGGSERWRLSRGATRVALAAGVAATLVVVGAVTVAYGSRVWKKISDPNAVGVTTDPAIGVSNFRSARSLKWSSALDTFVAHPLTGTGAGTSEFRINKAGEVDVVRNTHSLYLEQLAELGLPGLLLTLAFFAGLGLSALRARSGLRPAGLGTTAGFLAAFTVYLVHAGVDWMWQMTAVSTFAIAGAAVVATATSQSPSRGGRWLRVAAAAAAIAASLVQVPGAVSNARVRDSQAAFSRGDLGSAWSAATDAIAAEPWAATPYAQRAVLAESTGALQPARTDVLRAIAREPENFRFYLLLARMEAELGAPQQALAAYRKARELRPASPFVAAR